jgi:hypothetical protein
MATQRQMRLEVEALADRILPSTSAIFSNGMLFVQGDNAGNSIQVSAQASGTIQVTDHGHAIAIAGTPATLTNLKVVVEQSGSGTGNILSTDASLGGVTTVLDATQGTNNVLMPNNKGPSTQMGGHGLNYLLDNPGGGDVQIGGGYSDSQNLYDWEPGTGTDVVIGRGSHNSLLVVGNNNGQGETDQMIADGHGGFVYQRTNLVPFNIYASDVQDVVIRPSSGNDTVTIGDMTGVQGLKKVEVDGGGGNDTIDFSHQRNTQVAAIFNGGAGANTDILGAGTNYVVDTSQQDTIVIPPHSGRFVEVNPANASSYLADFDDFLALLAKK